MAKVPPNQPRSEPPDAGLSVDAIATELRKVLRLGPDRLNPASQGPLLALRSVRRQAQAADYPDSDDGLILALRDVVTDAVGALGDGDSGQAARLLFGTVPDTRGRSLTDRRRLAGDALDVVASTFRKNYEPRLINEVAAELLRAEHNPGLKLLTDSDPLTDSAGEGPLRVVIGAPAAMAALLPSIGRSPLAGRTAGFEWVLLGLLAAAVVWRIWDFGAVLRVAVVALAGGLVVTIAAIVRSGSDRAGMTQALLPRLPRLAVLSTASVLVIGALTTDEGVRERDIPMCDPTCTPTTPPTTTANAPRSPNYVPVTVAPVPAERSPNDCPPEGNQERRLSFSYNPPACIDFNATHQATVVTNFGTFRILLNTSLAPWTVNNFVYLARWSFFDGITLTPHPKSVTSSTVMLAGDPIAPTDTEKAPGYTLTFDTSTYPDLPVTDDQRFWVVMGDTHHPNRWAVAITEDAQVAYETNPNRWPLAGQVSCGIDVIANDSNQSRYQPAYTSAAIVIDHITIDQLTPEQTPPLRPSLDCDQYPGRIQ